MHPVEFPGVVGGSMRVSDIQVALWRLYHNHMYHLYNSYLYNWECDYYSRSKSGKDYEVEIKLSRSDFFADFKKEKHRLFKAVFGKDKFFIKSHGQFHNGPYAWYDVGLLSNRRTWMRPGYHTQLEISESATHTDFLNGYRDFHLEKKRIAMYAMSTQISITPVEKIKIPHRFYYACPDGLLRPDEVPAYAGLIHIRGAAAYEVKKAPFLHKIDVDLTHILLKKFYYETVDHRRQILLRKS